MLPLGLLTSNQCSHNALLLLQLFCVAIQLTKFALDNLNKSVSDPELRAKLTPTYTLGCKRVLGSDRYYPALQQDNVELMTSAVTKVCT